MEFKTKITPNCKHYWAEYEMARTTMSIGLKWRWVIITFIFPGAGIINDV